MSSSAGPKSEEECSRWMQRVHEVQSRRTPEAMEAARLRVELARQHEASSRKCKAAKSHAVRSRLLAAEGLRQMSCSAPAAHMEVQARWKSAQEASRARQEVAMFRADEAVSTSAHAGPMAVLRDADEEEGEALAEAAGLVGATDAAALSALAVGSGGDGHAAAGPHGGDAPAVEALLRQLRKEPKDEAECAAKFLLYEGYGSEVEQMRGTLLKFHEETRKTVPPAIAGDMDKQVKRIDSTDAMGIPDDAREWFVYHMMRQASSNNHKMAAILDGFEKKLEFLASNNQSECPVCLEAFEASGAHSPETLGCCHKVCKECWENWTVAMRGRPFCPLCRNEEFLGRVARHAGPSAGGRYMPGDDGADEDGDSEGDF